MAKPTGVWGIDIGQCALKAIRLELVDAKPTATAFDYIEHSKILSQPDADPDALTKEALEKFLSRNQLGNDIIGIGIPGQSGLMRFVKLPPVEEKKIPDIVKFEAKQQIPFPLEEVVWDYQKISGGEQVGEFSMETEVGLFAMKREMISRYMGHFNAVNIECHVVQMAPLALTNFANYEILKRGGPDAPAPEEPGEDAPRGKKRCVVVLDIGTDSSNLIITDGGKIIWQRPIPLGGNSFTRALTKEMKLTFAKAEHLKRNAAKSPDLAQILKALRPVLQDFVGEVQRSLGYFTNTHRDAHIAYMVGLGSAFKLPGLQKYMAEKLSLEVRKPAAFDRLSGDNVRNDSVFTENLLTFPIAYGLALQGVNLLSDRNDYGRIRTNLLPHEIRIDRMIRAKKPWAAAAAAALLLGTGTLAMGYAFQHGAVTDSTMKKAAEDAKGVIDQATKQETARGAAAGEVGKLQEDVKAVIAGNDDRLNFVRVHEVIALALPQAGERGNLNDNPQQQSLWSTPDGMRALAKSRERVKNGIPLEKINEEDLTSYLAQVNIESVYCRYTENLKGVYDNADNFVVSQYSRDIARDMRENEREEIEESGKKRPKPKGIEGAGWVFQVSGYTYHQDGTDFVIKGVLRNFQKAEKYAAETAMILDPKTGRKVEKVGKFLTGVKDPVKGNVSHMFLLISQQVAVPNERINKNYIDTLLPAAGGDAATPTTATDTGSNDAAGPSARSAPGFNSSGGGGAAGGWVPLTGSGSTAGAANSGSSGAMSEGGPGGLSAGDPLGGGGPTGSPDSGSGGGIGARSGPAVTTTNARLPGGKGAKIRCEFVLCFTWKEPVAGAATAAEPEKK